MFIIRIDAVDNQIRIRDNPSSDFDLVCIFHTLVNARGVDPTNDHTTKIDGNSDMIPGRPHNIRDKRNPLSHKRIEQR